MQEVLQEHALDARRLVLAQPGDGLVGRADDPVAGELRGVRVRVVDALALEAADRLGAPGDLVPVGAQRRARS